jgi:putative DNA primase/helicase
MNKFLNKLLEDVKIIIKSGNELEWKHYLKIFGKYNPITNTMYSMTNCNSLNYFVETVDNKKTLSQDKLIDPRFSTFKQIQSIGCKVKKGAKARQIIFFLKEGEFNLHKDHPAFNKMKDNLTQQELTIILNGGKVKKSCHVEKIFNVFNYQDIDGVQDLNNNFSVDEIDKFLLDSGVEIINDIQEVAFYSLKQHKIKMPLKTQFVNKESYYAVLLHEYAHWTNKELNRDITQYHNDTKIRAKEELVAEMSAANLCHYFKLNYDINNHKSYLADWGNLLNDEDFKYCLLEAEKIINFANKLLFHKTIDR